MLIHCQPQVLRQHSSVALDDVKDGGSIEPPLPHKTHEGLFSITLIHVEVQELPVPAPDILWLHFDPHVAGNILLYDAPTCMEGGREGGGGERQYIRLCTQYATTTPVQWTCSLW